MTKKIRVENADTSDWKVKVEVWQTNADGISLKVKEMEIDNPCEQIEEYVHDGQFLVIKENGHAE